MSREDIYNAVKSAKKREGDTPRPSGTPLKRGFFGLNVAQRANEVQWLTVYEKFFAPLFYKKAGRRRQKKLKNLLKKITLSAMLILWKPFMKGCDFFCCARSEVRGGSLFK
jgi:hypothetical protein